MSLEQRVRALEDQLERLRTNSVPRAVVARYQTATAQSIPNAAATIINFDTSTFDPDACVTTGASWAYTAKVAGYYRITAASALQSTTAWAVGESASIRLYKNGAVQSILDYDDAMASAAVAQVKALFGTDVLALAVGDTVDVRWVQSSGGALTLHPFAVHNYISICKVN